jgi:hypothetical protein
MTKRARTKQPKTDKPAEMTYEKLTQLEMQDAIGQIAHEVGIVESLADAAVEVAGRAGDDRTRRRRLGDLVVQIASAARDAYATARELDEKIRAV